MSNQYPGQPGDLPPTQVAPGGGGVPPQQPGYPQGYPQQPPPPPPYGAPGGGGGYPPGGGYPAPPTGGGGGKKLGLILGILGGVLLLVLILIAVLFWPIGLLTDDDGDDDATPKVTRTITASTEASSPTTSPTEVTTTPTTELTTELTTDAGTPPLEDAEITAIAYLNSLVEGNCLAVQGLSTEEWWGSTYGSQRACERDAGDQEMSTVQYDEFEEPVDNGDGSYTLVASVQDSTDTTGTTYTATWIVVPSDDNSTWLVNQFQLA
ncbi:hypothetical protein [Nocardioides antri]|uniref:hypothetical protein n=1 Tax=Nocardioides antri TaxID=2607659 RepID=UPI00165FDC77|nr:hypothetical protein [Nocardioides antri]